jgi:hypothetical protein
MIDLKKLSLSELKLIIKEYKNYISPKLTELKKDDLINLINKFNITLSNEDKKKIKLIERKKENRLKEPKVLTPEEKEAKQRKIDKQKFKNKILNRERINDEVNKEVEQLKKEGKYDYNPTPKKEKVDFNFTSLHIPTKLKKSNYSNQQLNALYGDYEDELSNDKLNNIVRIMKENDKYKYVYDRFKEFVKYFKDTKIKYYIDDLMSYDYDYSDMPKNKRTRLPIFDNKFYDRTVGANKIGHDDYVNYIKKAIKDIKAEFKENPKEEPTIKVAKEPKPKKEPTVKVAKEPKKRKPIEIKLKPGIATKIKLNSIKSTQIEKYKKYINRIKWKRIGTYKDPKWKTVGSYTDFEPTGTYHDPQWEAIGTHTDFKPTGTYHDPQWEATGTYHNKRKPIQLKVKPIIVAKIKWEPIGTYKNKIKRMQLKVKPRIVAKAKWEKIGKYKDPKWEATGSYTGFEPTGTYHDPQWITAGSYTDFKPTGTYHDPQWEATGTYHDKKADYTFDENFLSTVEQKRSKENREYNPLIGDMYKLNMTYDIITNLDRGYQNTKKFKDYYPERFEQLKHFFTYCLENNIKVDMDKFVYEEINNDYKPKFFYPNFLMNLIVINRNSIPSTINTIKRLIKSIDSRFDKVMFSTYNILEHPFYQGIQNLIQSLTPEQINEAKNNKYHNFYTDPEHIFHIYNY